MFVMCVWRCVVVVSRVLHKPLCVSVVAFVCMCVVPRATACFVVGCRVVRLVVRPYVCVRGCVHGLIAPLTLYVAGLECSVHVCALLVVWCIKRACGGVVL